MEPALATTDIQFQIIPPTVVGYVATIITVASLLLFLFHTFLILYHLLRFGVGPRPKQFALFSFAVSMTLLAGGLWATRHIFLG